MELENLAPWAETFAAFCVRLDDLLALSESQRQMHKHLRGLVAPLERRANRQLAELVQDTTPDRLQHLLYPEPWGSNAVRDRLEQFVRERFGEPDGIGVLDAIGILKKGTRSVEVAKQYCGAMGKFEHCRAATSSWTGACISPKPGATTRGGALAPISRRRPTSKTSRSGHAPAWSGSKRADALGDWRQRLWCTHLARCQS